jgi:UDP-N-acetylglucosamine 2-epimerase (non-hydrolysing)
MPNHLKIVVVAGARPNFMKVAPLVQAMRRYPQLEVCLVHTGQHYNFGLSKIFFDELGIPHPAYELGVGSASHTTQTAEIMKRFESVCLTEQPDLVVVVGDVNSTLACSLVAAKLEVRVAHVEAGLRSFDRSMPEEINRIVTDALADYLFTTEQSANMNLIREGVDPDRIFYVGNVMIDTLRQWQDRASQSAILQRLRLSEMGDILPYGVVTVHRPHNVETIDALTGIFSALEQLAQELPLIFPVHPRTQHALKAIGRTTIEQLPVQKAPTRGDILLVEPLGYLDFLRLLEHAELVLTDSGGIQEEATILGVPCVTLRSTTERPVTLELGLNVLAGAEPEQIVRLGKMMLKKGRQRVTPPPLWDGQASGRIVEILVRESENGRLGGRATSSSVGLPSGVHT